jgi:hypothetical protein
MHYWAKYDNVKFSGQIYSWGHIKILLHIFLSCNLFLGIFESLISGQTKPALGHGSNRSAHTLLLHSFIFCTARYLAQRNHRRWGRMRQVVDTVVGPLVGTRTHRWVDAPPLSSFSVAPYPHSSSSSRNFDDTSFFPHGATGRRCVPLPARCIADGSRRWWFFYRSNHDRTEHIDGGSVTSRAMAVVVTGNKTPRWVPVPNSIWDPSTSFYLLPQLR